MTGPTAFPLPDAAFAPVTPLWEAAQHDEFRLPRCGGCGAFDWYPTGTCPACQGQEIGWVRLGGRGTLFSWATVRRALHPPLAILGTYVSAIVAIAEDPRTRFVTRLIDADPARLRADMPVAVRFADIGYPAIQTGIRAPLFAPLTRE